MIESGTKMYRSRMTINDEKIADCDFYTVYPLMLKFCLPGDIWRIHTDMLVRYQPMLAPTLTRSHARVRFAFVPLRLLEKDIELIVTGSQDGHLYTGELPVCKTFFNGKGATTGHYCVHKGDFANFGFGMAPNDNLDAVKDDESMPADYFYKAYCRFWWDYFRDENLWWTSDLMATHADFDEWYSFHKQNCFSVPSWNSANYGGHGGLLPVFLQKNYLTSALPWQLKGTAPAISFDPIVNSANFLDNTGAGTFPLTFTGDRLDLGAPPFEVSNEVTEDMKGIFNANMAKALSDFVSSGLALNAADLRAMFAQTRVFERLARTGSRYTEYLRANFGTAPADETLQRAQYLGGYKIPIVTSEVLQTAEDGNTPVGTMRGHGITRGGDHMQTFHCKEFGVLLATIDFRPEITWTQGVDRQFTYKRRFDFFNPSFQHLSEQEVRNGEVFISATAEENDRTFGFQAYAQELRMGRKMVVGDMAGTQAYWTQTIDFSARPNLNSSFLIGWNHLASVHKPFAVTDKNPIILQFAASSDVYRPMVRYATPGLIDHL